MVDKFTKVILTGILICLIVIAFKPNKEYVTTPTPYVNIDNTQQFVQIAPNRIGIVDSGSHTGYKGQLIIFDFNPDSKTFKYVETLKASYILDHPEEYGIPISSK
jgi:hypothetical protein